LTELSGAPGEFSVFAAAWIRSVAKLFTPNFTAACITIREARSGALAVAALGEMPESYVGV
jgi:hypothetical protein